MYKILIVDDEAFVRRGIKNNLRWNELGYELVGDCENGNEAMEAIAKFQPDVVLTDICMPFVDGIELTKYISTTFPQTKVVILTGYDEFDYAQQAVKLKAYDYILKPVTANELSRLLEKLKRDMDEEKHKLEDMSRIKSQLRESLPLLKVRFLNRLVTGQLQENDRPEDKFEYFSIDFCGIHYLIMIIDVDDSGALGRLYPEMEDELLFFAVFNITEEIIEKYGGGVVFQNNIERTLVILSGDSIDDLLDKSVAASEEIRQAVEKFLWVTVTIGIGNACTDLSELKASLQGAQAALDYRFFMGRNRVITISDIEGPLNSVAVYKKEWEKKLITGIKTGTVQEIDEIIGCVFTDFRDALVSMDNCYIHIQHIMVSIVHTLYELRVGESEIASQELNLLNEIYKFKTLEDMERWFRIFCKKASALLYDKRNDYCKSQALKAEAYIQDNYMDENLSLHTVCKYLLMSTSYFSQVFKSTTGETFIEYLTRIRIEKAMELLRMTELKAYEVAHRVGYGDPHYFSLAFKKVTGVTPTEYRDKGRNV